jgi:hypothetical protein
MDGPLAGATVFACLFSSALAGVAVHARLPGRILPRRAGGAVRRGLTLAAGLAAVLLAVMTLAQKTSFDNAERDVQQLSTELILLDHTLRQAGPDAEPAREWLFRYTVGTIQAIWPGSDVAGHRPEAAAAVPLERLEDAIGKLGQGDARRQAIGIKAQRILRDAARMQGAVQRQDHGPLSPYLIGITVFWLMLTFASFGLSPPPGVRGGNSALLAALFLGALALGGAMFLLREYNDPFAGVIVVSHEPLQNVLFAISE